MERKTVLIHKQTGAAIGLEPHLTMPTKDQLAVINAMYDMDIKRDRGQRGQSSYHTEDGVKHYDSSINNIVKENLIADIKRERGRRWKGFVNTTRVGASKTQLRLQKKWGEKYGKKVKKPKHIITPPSGRIL